MDLIPTKQFTRFVTTLAIPTARLGDAVKDLERMRVSTRSGDGQPVWVPLDESVVANQVKFFLPWISRYLKGEVPKGSLRKDRDCVALRWSPDVKGRQQGCFSAESPRGPRDSRRRYDFAICDVEAYFFSTGIVAVAAECELLACNGTSPSLDDVINFNYDLQHLADDRAPVVRLIPTRADGRVQPMPFSSRSALPEGTTLFRIIEESLEPVFSGPHEMLDAGAFRVLTYVALPEGTDSRMLGEHFYRLRRVVKESYEAAPADLPLEGRSDTIQTFANVFVGFSLEGMAMLAIESSQPFTQERPNRFRCSYFAHFLLALHQRAALLSLALEAGELPRITMGLLEGGAQMDQHIRELRLRAIDFNLHHRFATVSTMTHYARMYDAVVQELAIPALVDEVRDEIAELDEVLSFYREREQQAVHRQQEDARRRAADSEAQRDRRLNGLVAALGPASLLLSLYGTNLPDYAQDQRYQSPAFLVPLGIWVVATGVLWWWMMRRKASPSGD